MNNIDTEIAVITPIDYLSYAKQYASAFESLRIDNIDGLLALFSEQARFVDPFNDVVGKAAINEVFKDMFENTNIPQFVVKDIVLKDNMALLIWDFSFQFKQRDKTVQVEGCSQIYLDAAGNVTFHKDFWDPCQGLYEHLPLIGKIFRWLRGRLAVKSNE